MTISVEMHKHADKKKRQIDILFFGTFWNELIVFLWSSWCTYLQPTSQVCYMMQSNRDTSACRTHQHLRKLVFPFFSFSFWQFHIEAAPSNNSKSPVVKEQMDWKWIDDGQETQ